MMSTDEDSPADPGKCVITRRKPEEVKDELIQVYEEAYSKYPQYAENGNRCIKSYLNWLEKKRPEGFLVATVDDEVMGFAVEDLNWKEVGDGEVMGEIMELVVSPRARGHGLGKKLLRLLINILNKHGRTKIGLEVGVDNSEAYDLYEKHGFKYHDNDGTWICMVLDTEEAPSYAVESPVFVPSYSKQQKKTDRA